MSLRHPSRTSSPARLIGRRIVMRPLAAGDFRAWSEVRVHNEEWLTMWEPRRNPSLPDPTVERSAFSARCAQRDRDRAIGIAYQFGLFIGDQIVVEVNFNNVLRGALPSRTLAHLADQLHPAHGYVAEHVSALPRYAL